MINRNEMIFTVDENNNPIKPLERHVAHEQGIWHRTTDIAVVNSKNQILCHKRSMLKDNDKGMWDACFGGHILAEIDSIVGAKQELLEESGLKADSADLEFITINKHTRGQNKEFRYLYIYRWEGEINQLNLEREEIDEAKWVDLAEVAKNRDNQAEWVQMPYLDNLLGKFVKI